MDRPKESKGKERSESESDWSINSQLEVDNLLVS